MQSFGENTVITPIIDSADKLEKHLPAALHHSADVVVMDMTSFMVRHNGHGMFFFLVVILSVVSMKEERSNSSSAVWSADCLIALRPVQALSIPEVVEVAELLSKRHGPLRLVLLAPTAVAAAAAAAGLKPAAVVPHTRQGLLPLSIYTTLPQIRFLH